MRNLILVLILTWCCSAAKAFQPDEGWWWNANEPGRGWNMEYQAGVMFISTFIYASDGRQLWYTSAGNYNASTRTFTATLDATTGGQCFGCPPRTGNTQVAAGGPISIVFDSAVTGRLTTSTGTINITRFNFAFPTADSLLPGWWVMTRKSIITDGEVLVFDGTFTASNGTRYISGYRDGSPNNIALARFETNLNRILILLDSSTSYYESWLVDTTFDKMEGVGWLYLKTSLPTGTGDVTFGFRAGYQNDPRQTARAGNAVQSHESMNRLMSVQSGDLAPPEIIGLTRELGSALEEFKQGQQP